MEEFQKIINKTKNSIRNPLGIIGLFISLIYGFACLVLNNSIEHLENKLERLPLIYFIILFPIIILGVFVFLVVKHHEKLYAPSDFQKDDSFIRLKENKGPEEKKKKLSKEAKELENASVQKFQEVEKEQIKKKPEDLNPNSHGELVNLYEKIENWTIEKLSLKYNADFRSNVSLTVGGIQIRQDAVAHTNDKIYLLEVKYWRVDRSDNNLKKSIEKFLNQRNSIKQTFHSTQEIKFVVALVFNSLDKVDKQHYFKFIKNLDKDANVEFFDVSDITE